MGERNGRWDGQFIGKVCYQFSDRAADVWQPQYMFGGLYTLVQRVSCTSRYYPKGIPKSNVCPMVSRTSIVLFVERTSGGPPRTSALLTVAYVRLLRVSVWLLFSKGLKCV
jgi:hypothetical protein